MDQQDAGGLRAPPMDAQARHGTEWYVPFCSMSTRLWLAVLCGYSRSARRSRRSRRVLARGPGTVGLLVTLAAAATAVTRPFAGRFADRGRALGVARAGAALVAVGAAGHLVAERHVRARAGAADDRRRRGRAVHRRARARAARPRRPQRRGRLIGHFGLSMWGGLAAGPPLAALVAAQTARARCGWRRRGGAASR